MRTGAAAGHEGYLHEVAFVGSDDEFLALVVPFLEEGLAAGEPVVAAFAPPNEKLLRSALGSCDGIRFLSNHDQYQRPASTIRGYKRLFAELVAAGAGQIRVSGDMPHPGVGIPWDWWARYEAAVNSAWAEFPLWTICPYDTRVTPAEVLDDVRRTHPSIATASGEHFRNGLYEEPSRFLAAHRNTWTDPVERLPAAVELFDPAAAQVRKALTWLCRDLPLDAEDVNGLLLSATEVVTNATLHGKPPVRVRMWQAGKRVIVAVTDQGSGPGDPFAGLLPGESGRNGGGLGLWLAHQLCSYVSWQETPEGFTVRLAAGDITAGH